MASRWDGGEDEERQRSRNSFCEGEAADWRSSLAEDEVFSWPRPKTLRLRRTPLGFGFTLRHFIVYPPESCQGHAYQPDDDHGRRGRPRNRLEPMDTIFVKQVKEGGPAHGAGLCTGDRIVKVNGASIIGKAYCQVIALIQDSGDFLELCVMPKDEDILQLAYSQDAYLRGQSSYSGNARLIPAPPPPCYPRVESSVAAMAQTTSDPVGRAPPPDHAYRKEIPVPPSPPRCFAKSQTAVCVRNDGVRTVVVPQSAAMLAGRMAPGHRLDFIEPAFPRGARPGSLAQYPPPRKVDAHPAPYGGPPALCPGNHQNIDWRTYQTYREYIDNKGIHSHASRTIQERLDNLRGSNAAPFATPPFATPQFAAPHHIPRGDWIPRGVRRRSTSHERSYPPPPNFRVAPRSLSQDRILSGEKLSPARSWAPRSASQDGLVHKARAHSLDYGEDPGRQAEWRGGYGRAEPGARPSRQAMPRHAAMYRPSPSFAVRPPPTASLYTKGTESFQTRSSPMLHDRPPHFAKSSSAEHSFSEQRVAVRQLATQHSVKRIRAESLQPGEVGREVAVGTRSSSCSAPKELPKETAPRPGILKAPPPPVPAEDGVRQHNGRSPAEPEVVLREKPGKQPSPLRQPSYILALSDDTPDPNDAVAACWLPNDARREISIRRLGDKHATSCSSNLDESLDLIPFIDEPVSPSVDREAASIPPSAVISVAQSVTAAPSSQGSPCPPIRRQLSHDQESLRSALLDSDSAHQPERSKSYDEGLDSYQEENSRRRSSSKNTTSFRGAKKTLDGLKPADTGSRRDSNADVFADSAKEGTLSFRQLGTDKNKRVGGGMRSWKQVYAVLQGATLTLYRDRKEALSHASTPCQDEPSPPPLVIDTTACLVDISYSDTRRKNVLRLTTTHCHYLLQAEGRDHMLAWIHVIQEGSGPDQENAAVTSQELISRKIREYNMMSAPSSRSEPSPKSSRQSLSIKQAFLGAKTDSRVLSPHSPRAGEERRTARAEDGSPPRDRTWRMGIAGIMRKPFEKKTPAGITFGVRLDDCPSAHSNRLVPLMVELCCQVVEQRGLDYTGIYRVPGNNAAISSLQEELNTRGLADIDLSEDKWRDLNVISSLLKSFFRKLPEPLFTNEKYGDFIEASRTEDSVERLKELKKLIYELPDHHYETLKFLCSHLKKVSDNCEKNKMEPRNLAIVFGPTLVRTSEDNMANMVNHMPDQCKIVENLIQQHDWFFSHDAQQEPAACSDQESTVQSQPVPNIDHLLSNIGRTAASPGENSDSTCSDSSRSKLPWSGRDQVSREMLRSSFFANRKRKKPKDKAVPSSSDDDLDAMLPGKEAQEEEVQKEEEPQEVQKEEEPGWVHHHHQEEEGVMEGSREEEAQQETQSPSPPSGPSPPASPGATSDLGTLTSTLTSTGSVGSGGRRGGGGGAPAGGGGGEEVSITSDYSTTSSTLPGVEPRVLHDDADDERSELVSEGRGAETDSESDLSVFAAAGAEQRPAPRPLPALRLIEGDTLSRKKAAAKAGSESSLEGGHAPRPAQRRSTTSLGSAHNEEGAEPAWRPRITERLKLRLRLSVDDMFGVGSQRAEPRSRKKKNIRRRHTMGGQRDFAQLSLLDGWAAGAGSRCELSAVDRLRPKCSSQDFSIGDWIARERHRTSNPEVSLDPAPFPDSAPQPLAEAPPTKNLSLSGDAHPHKLTSSHVVNSRFYQYL